MLAAPVCSVAMDVHTTLTGLLMKTWKHDESQMSSEASFFSLIWIKGHLFWMGITNNDILRILWTSSILASVSTHWCPPEEAFVFLNSPFPV